MNETDLYERHMTASVFVLNRQRQVLLLRHKSLGVWLYPGGHVERHETPDDAALREVREETGLTVRFIGQTDSHLDEPASKVTALQLPYRILCEFIPKRDDPHYHIDLIYVCQYVEGDLDAARLHTPIGFFGREESETMDLFPNFRRMLMGVFDDSELWKQLESRGAVA
jgi:ADP-ribose pyrophosphatase YjhB (NUDIX family)